MKILKKEWFIWKFWKKGGGGVVEKRGRRKRNPCPMRLWYIFEIGLHLFYQIDKANQIYYSSAKTDKINYKIKKKINFKYMYH